MAKQRRGNNQLRNEVIEALRKKPRTIAELDARISSNTAGAVRALVLAGEVLNLTPDRKRGATYGVSPEPKEILTKPSPNGASHPNILREMIREIAREVAREVIKEELEALLK